MVHAGYGYSAELEMIVAFVVDAESEEWRVKTWPGLSSGGNVGPEEIAKRVGRLWDFFEDFARASAIEWRMTICSLGLVPIGEIEAWQNHPGLKKNPVTLLMCDAPPTPGEPIPRPRPQVVNMSPAVLNDPSTRIIDESLASHYFPLPIRKAVDLPPASSSSSSIRFTTHRETVYPVSSFITSLSTPTILGGHSAMTYYVVSHSPAPGKREEDVDALLARDFYRLAALGRKRFRFNSAGPLHLEAVRAVLNGVARWVEQVGEGT